MSLKNPIRIGIAGCTGRVGRLLIAELQSGAWPDFTLAIGSASSPQPDSVFPVTADAAKLFAGSDIIIDFTAPAAIERHARLAAERGKPLVVGTTGLDSGQERVLRDAAGHVPILYAVNTSIGVTLLQKLVEETAATLGLEWDIQISETHHRQKKDAPSGTALLLGRAAGERAVGYASQRGGDVVGEHTVTFYGAGERIALTHIATDRALFARGALRAAQWLVGQPAGLYTMRDALALSVYSKPAHENPQST